MQKRLNNGRLRVCFVIFTVRKFSGDKRIEQLGRDKLWRKQLWVLLQSLTAKGKKNSKTFNDFRDFCRKPEA